MNKIGIIIAREFFTRVKSRVFFISTLLGPLLLAGFVVVPIWLATQDNASKKIGVLDQSGLLTQGLQSKGSVSYIPVTGTRADWKKKLLAETDTLDGLLVIPKTFTVAKPAGVEFDSKSSLGPSYVEHIETDISKLVERQRIQQYGISNQQADSLDVEVNVATFKLTEKGSERSSSGAAMGVGMGAGFLMYMFMFLYGMQVLRGVVEEKSNRIVEVLISTVKPIELMMGKIIGIAGVGLFQFLLWILLSLGLTQLGISLFKPAMVAGGAGRPPAEIPQTNVFDALGTINYPLLIGLFILFFLLGYLMYATLFAAVGSAVDSETDTQQLLFPITMPIILSIIIAQMAAQNPDGNVARIFSLIPLTSPIVMMARLPYKEHLLDWEVITSLILLVLGFLGSVWVASRIYRVGVLMYGKKPTLKEMGKWIFYKG